MNLTICYQYRAFPPKKAINEREVLAGGKILYFNNPKIYKVDKMKHTEKTRSLFLNAAGERDSSGTALKS